ncbi:uncharacterized protein LOC135208434 isoform X2 [Macrobrachium nipponense]|uniref:uncharacterized protein LOC135208434 isoform X2 n=1 Tax=Macrobrachium nipponense TaxID=159736 RepID=UPI0030C7B496
MLHSGLYAVLSEMHKRFWIPQYFSAVKKVIKECVLCKKTTARTIKTNQNAYRDFRIDPPSVPFRYVFVDHFGPFNIKIHGKNSKVWILCLSCLWSRAINLKICDYLTTKEYLRSLQLHCFQYGIPELILSDLGSQLVAGGNIVADFLNDPELQSYFDENNIKRLRFEQYPKGCKKLGGLVEICVKMCKKLIHSAVKNYVLEYREFEFIIEQAVHLINRRPIAFKESLRDALDVPEAITPEMLIHGYSLASINIIPNLQLSEGDLEWSIDNPVDEIRNKYHKLLKVKSNLIEKYNFEFLTNLIYQATNEKSRYKPVDHKKPEIGDIVLIKETNTKPSNYPMAVVKKIKINELDEVSEVELLKGGSRELVRRHVVNNSTLETEYCYLG